MHESRAAQQGRGQGCICNKVERKLRAIISSKQTKAEWKDTFQHNLDNLTTLADASKKRGKVISIHVHCVSIRC